MYTTKEKLAYLFLKTRFCNTRKNFFPEKKFVERLSIDTKIREELITNFFENFLGYKNNMFIGKLYIISYKIVQVIFEKNIINFSEEKKEEIAKKMGVEKKELEHFMSFF